MARRSETEKLKELCYVRILTEAYITLQILIALLSFILKIYCPLKTRF